MSWLFEPECRPKCRCKRHALEFNSAISKGSLTEVKAYSRMCHSIGHTKDTVGRLPLHVAAACGKLGVVEWLLTDKHGDLTEKDSESGWTALHRALFYGQLPVAMQLIQHGSDLYSRDHEGLSALDIVMKDRQRNITYDVKEPSEVYVWGDNPNFNLGLASGQSRTTPEVIDEFKRAGVFIHDIVLSKYHTVFLSQLGGVHTCGHGHGGRLGQDNELTCVVPRQVKSLRNETCVQIAAARDHTVMLLESGSVYSCGLNTFHQLGQHPPPDKSIKPKQMNLKVLKGKKILGVCVGRFHTVVYTSGSVVTFGLNAGQLGHQKGDKLQSLPRIVSALSHKDVIIESVSCSDAATVCLTNKGEIFVLHEYQCRRIMSKWLGSSDKVLVYGGKLDHCADLDLLREKGGTELKIAVLTKRRQIFLWRESLPTPYRCHWAIKRQLFVVDMVLSDTTMCFVTDTGEGFIGYWPNRKPVQQKEQSATSHKKIANDFEKDSLMDLMLKDDIETIPVKRIANIHRGTKLFADRKQSNFMVIQALPHGCLSDLPSISGPEIGEHLKTLYDEADETDAIHDVIVEAGNRHWACHVYILASRCDFFRNKAAKLYSTGNKDDDSHEEKPVFTVPEIPPEIIEQVLIYIYTDTCTLLKVGSKFDPVMVESQGPCKGEGDSGPDRKYDSDLVISERLAKRSAYEVYQMKKDSAHCVQKENSDPQTIAKNPVRYLQEVARQLGVKRLAKKLEAVKYVGGCIQSGGKSLAPPRIIFDRTKLPELYDVAIQAEDSTAVDCHKCVLVARLEYFRSMLGSGWIETSNTLALTLPVPGSVLTILLDFLYTDDSHLVTDCQQVELLCNVLMVADQLLVARLHEMCEVSLANLITFRNVGDILEFASIYNAAQLKATCQQFISLNLGALLEGRYLDVLSEETAEELRDYYRDTLSCMSRRMITPYSDAPQKDFLEALAARYQDDPSGHVAPDTSTHRHKPKKRRSRTKSSNDDADKTLAPVPRQERQISICSDISMEEERTEEAKSVTEEPQSPQISETSKTLASPLMVPIPVTEKPQPNVFSSPPIPKGKWGESSPPPLHALPSPLSPTGGVSLRDIMTQQEGNVKVKQHADKRGLGGKFSWKDVKKQQNKAAQNVQTKKEEIESTALGQNTCPWTSSVNKVVPSFRDLMMEDGPPSRPSGTDSSPSRTLGSSSIPRRTTKPIAIPTSVSWGLPTSKTSRHHTKSQSDPCPPTSSPSNPWLTSDPQSPPASHLSFTDILKDEKEKKKALDYVSKKPLSLIQIEEQAIQELLVHYKASANPDVRVTVERVSQTSAAPLWSVNKRQTLPKF